MRDEIAIQDVRELRDVYESLLKGFSERLRQRPTLGVYIERATGRRFRVEHARWHNNRWAAKGEAVEGRWLSSIDGRLYWDQFTTAEFAERFEPVIVDGRSTLARSGRATAGSILP